jgi:hypothetical protein
LNNPNNLAAEAGLLLLGRSRQMGHLDETLGRRRGFCRGRFANNPGGRVRCENGQEWDRKGPQSTDRRAPRTQIQGGSMIRKRIAGFLFLVFAMAFCSVAIAQSKKQIDINSASEEEMVAIGIEKVAAKKIIEARPYRNKAELVSKQLLTRTQYDKLKDLIIAKQAAAIKEVPSKPAGK